jgi:hypothetical protein
LCACGGGGGYILGREPAGLHSHSIGFQRGYSVRLETLGEIECTSKTTLDIHIHMMMHKTRKAYREDLSCVGGRFSSRLQQDFKCSMQLGFLCTLEAATLEAAMHALIHPMHAWIVYARLCTTFVHPQLFENSGPWSCGESKIMSTWKRFVNM